MDETQFFQTILAVLCANMLTIAFLFGAHHISKAEREGRQNELGVASYALMALPPLIAGVGVWGFFG